MRSYYTYGAIPDPVRTVRGFDDGGLASAPRPGLAGAGGEDKPLMQQLYERGEVSEAEYRAWLAEQSAGPSKEYNPVTRLPTTMAQPGALTGLTMKDIFGGNVPAGIDPNAPFAPSTESAQYLSEADRLTRERVLEPGALSSFVGPTGTGTPIMQGNFSMLRPERSAAEVAADFAKASGLDLAGFAASQGKTEAELMADINKAETDPNTRRGALNEIKDKVSAGDFKGAFQEAKAAEARLGGDFVSNLVSPSTLRYLAPEMDKKDVNNYYDALKEVIGEKEYEKRYVSTGNEFSIEDARAKNLAAVDQGAAFVNPDVGVKAEETALSKLPVKQLALLTAAAMGATAIPGLFGTAGGAGTGAGAGAAGAGGTTGLEALTASQLAAAPTTAQIAASIGAPSIAGLGTAAGTVAGAAAVADAIPEILVSASKAGKLSEIVGALTKAGLGAATTSALSKIAAPSVTMPSEAAAATEAPAGLEEVTVQAQRPIDWSWLSSSLAAAPTAAQIASQMPPPNVPELGPPEVTPDELQEVQVKAQRPIDWSWLSPTLATVPGLEEILSQMGPPGVPDFAEPPLEEVVSQQPRIKYPPPVIPPLPTFPEPELQPPPKPEDILKDYKPTEIKEPTTIDKLIEKYGTLENALKVLGALGAATSGTGGGGAGVGTGAGAGAFGGALPKYTYERQQIAPPIDYYTYGTRPEAKFFEGSYKLAEPTQPAAPMVPPPSEPSGVVTSAAGGYIDDHMTGGLIGYAEGGKPERYVDGPGSGRDDKIPALLSDGEYVIDAETLALLGDGSSKEGARRMDQFRAKIRQHKGRALSRGRISPNAKSPEKYMGGGLS